MKETAQQQIQETEIGNIIKKAILSGINPYQHNFINVI